MVVSFLRTRSPPQTAKNEKNEKNEKIEKNEMVSLWGTRVLAGFVFAETCGQKDAAPPRAGGEGHTPLGFVASDNAS